MTNVEVQKCFCQESNRTAVCILHKVPENIVELIYKTVIFTILYLPCLCMCPSFVVKKNILGAI